MLKQRIVRLVATIALLAGIIGTSGIVADSLGLSVTSPAYACQSSSSSGGGC